MKAIKSTQLLLPVYPRECTLISKDLAVYEKDQLVQYLINGLPSFSHSIENVNSFRFITSNFIHMNLCQKVDIVRSFHVTEASVQRWYNVYLKCGDRGFYEGKGGVPTKMVDSRISRVHEQLDLGNSVNSIAAVEQISEGTIRYRLDQGKVIKKKM